MRIDSVLWLICQTEAKLMTSHDAMLSELSHNARLCESADYICVQCWLYVCKVLVRLL